MTRRASTRERDADMLALREGGSSVDALASRFGMAPKTVTSALTRARRLRDGKPAKAAPPPRGENQSDARSGGTQSEPQGGEKPSAAAARDGVSERDQRILDLHRAGNLQSALDLTPSVVAGVLQRANVTTPARARKALRSLASNQARSESLKARADLEAGGRTDGGMRLGEAGPPPRTCQYFVGPTEKGDAAKCGRAVDRRPDGTRRPYCADHAAVCYRPSSAQGGASQMGGFRL